VLVVEVDRVHAEAPQARVACLQDVLRLAVDAGGAVGLAQVAELGREHDLVAAPPERLAEQLLVVAPAVHVRGVEEVHAEVDRPVDDRDRLRVVALAVRAGHGHAAEADGRDPERAVAERSIVHWALREADCSAKR